MKAKHRFKGYIILALLLLSLAVGKYYYGDLAKFASPSYVRDYLLGLGHWGYLAYVILFVLSIPLPIPSTPVAIAGGYVYGIVLGTILTTIAIMIGSSICFWLVRYYGEPLLEKVVHKHHIIHFNHIFKKRGPNGAIIAYAIPVFPSDALHFILGLTNIRYHTFLLIVLLGNIPRSFIVSAFGQELYTGFTARTIIVSIFAVIFVLIAVFREKIKKIVFKELRFIEQEVEKEVEWVEEEVGMRKVKKIKKSVK